MRVALIGDSIRLNAEPFVRGFLPPSVELRSPAENCESSRKVAARIRDWVPPGSVDLVHINCGLHDLRHDPGCEGPVTPLEIYTANVREVFAYLARAAATVIWATSTPIDEEQHNRNKVSRRYRAHLLDYNRSAVAIGREFGFRIHDLHARLIRAGTADLLLSDGVHFNHAGNALIGRAIADAIVDAMPTTATEPRSVDTGGRS